MAVIGVLFMLSAWIVGLSPSCFGLGPGRKCPLPPILILVSCNYELLN